jgi:hypothetical protein
MNTEKETTPIYKPHMTVDYEKTTTTIKRRGKTLTGVTILEKITGYYYKYRNVPDDMGNVPPIEVFFPYADIESELEVSKRDVSRAVEQLKSNGVIYTCMRKKGKQNYVHFQLLDTTLIDEYGLIWLSGIPNIKKDNWVFYNELATNLVLPLAEAYKHKGNLKDYSFQFLWAVAQTFLKHQTTAFLGTVFTADNVMKAWKWFTTNYDLKNRYNFAYLKKAVPFAIQQLMENRDSPACKDTWNYLTDWHDSDTFEVPNMSFADYYQELTGEVFVMPVDEYLLEEA